MDVIGCTGGDAVLAQCHFLGNAAAKKARDLRNDVATTMAIAVFLGEEHGHTQRAATGNNRHFINRVMLRHQSADNGMPRLVVSRIALFRLGHHHRPALSTHHDLVFGQLKLIHTH